ncbi:MAG: hypothetical protein ABFC73_12455 [Clostridiaceae bacterium]
MLHHGTHYNAPIDWSDPEQAAAQVKIDLLRNLLASSPMSYSEKEELVRKQLADEARREEAVQSARSNPAGKKWDI